MMFSKNMSSITAAAPSSLSQVTLRQSVEKRVHFLLFSIQTGDVNEGSRHPRIMP